MEKFENIDQLLQEENKQLRASIKISLPQTQQTYNFSITGNT